MKRRNALVISLVMTLILGACSSGQNLSAGEDLPPWNPYEIIDPQTVSFSSLSESHLNLSTVNSCEQVSIRLRKEALQTLIRHFEDQDSYCNPPMFVGSSDSSSSNSSSFTQQNSQVEGVFEAEQVMTNGTIAAQIKNSEIVISQVWPLDQAQVLTTIPAPDFKEFRSSAFTKLILKDETLVGFYMAYTYNSQRKSGWATYDVSSPSSPVLLQSIHTESNELKVRLIGNQLTTVGTMNIGPAFSYRSSEFDRYEKCEMVDDGEYRFTKEFREVIATHLESQYQWLLNWSVERELPAIEGNTTKSITCSQIAENDYTTGDDLTVVTKGEVDADANELQTLAIAGNAVTTYVNHDKVIYLEKIDPFFFEVLNKDSRPITASVMHVIQHGNALVYKGSALVTGVITRDRPFQIDERKNVIRIATEVRDPLTRLGNTVLDVNFAIYRIEDQSVNLLSRVENIVASEEILAARYDSDRAYIVTFDVVYMYDPLFVIDTRNPESPQILGELEMPGFSSYLHQLDSKSLLGIGATSLTKGLGSWSQDYKLALYKVNDDGVPYEEEQILFESSHSGYYNHLNFHYEEDFETLYFPYYDTSEDGENRMKVITLNANELSETTDIELSQDIGWLLKSFRINDSSDDVLFFAGTDGLQMLDRSTLAELDQITY